jgi:phosphoribosyl-ATP pyrophosphohydrolase
MKMSVLNDLYQTVIDRKNEKQEGSYTCYLFEKGIDKICKKCGEECTEMVIAAKNNDNNELKNEIADLFYHVMVLCANQGLDITEVEDVLAERSKKTGNLKQFHVSDHNT